MLYIFILTCNIPKHEKVILAWSIIHFPYFLDPGSVLGWIGFNYVRTIRFYLSYTSTQVLTFFLTHIQQRRGCVFFRLTATATSLGIHTTTDQSCAIRYKSMGSANGGPTRDNIHATVGSITWNLHHQKQVESANAEQCAYQKISTRSSDATVLDACAPPPWFRTKASQNLASLYERKNKYRYEGSTCPLTKTPFKRPGSKYFL